jgi:hypothetical protein
MAPASFAFCDRPSLFVALRRRYNDWMALSPCRFNVPLTDNEGQPIDPQMIVDLHRELLGQFGGFTIHPTSEGRWQSRAGRVYQEEVIVYEVAIPHENVALLRDVVCRLGRRLGQLAMYFDAPSPSVEIIDLSLPSGSAPAGGSGDESRPEKRTRRRGKGNRPPG